jgi:hypothetical protein
MASPSLLFAPLVAIYLLVGCACAVLAFTRGGLANLIDAALLLLFWPLYGPFFLMRRQGTDGLPIDKEAAFLAAIRRASGTPLGRLLPDGATARALARRLRTAARKVRELDALLLRPDFSEAQAAARVAELDLQGSSTALASAAMRLHNIHRLRALRDRFARELDEVGELVAQLTAQAEVLRLDHGLDAHNEELVTELLSRVEGLDQIIDDGGSAAHQGAT